MKSPTLHHHRSVVRAVLRHVRDIPTGSLTDLADIASLSPFHFHRIFKRLTGRTPDGHLRSLRLVKAAIALRTTTTSILTIALNARYENPESFSRAFRRDFNISPRAYRAKHLIKGTLMKSLNPTINLIKIPVTNFPRARAFYRDTLGLEEEFAVDEYGWAQYKTTPVPLCLYAVGMGGGAGKPGGETNFHLAVSDAKAAYALLQARGASLPCELVLSDDGGAFFMVADPDGNTFKIMQAT